MFRETIPTNQVHTQIADTIDMLEENHLLDQERLLHMLRIGDECL